jgi:hypothetical protein
MVMDSEFLKIFVPFFILILGSAVTLGISIYNSKKIIDDVEKADADSLADGAAGKE